MPAVSTPTYSMCVLGHVLCTDIKTAHEGIFPIGVHIRILYTENILTYYTCTYARSPNHGIPVAATLVWP